MASTRLVCWQEVNILVWAKLDPLTYCKVGFDFLFIFLVKTNKQNTPLPPQ